MYNSNQQQLRAESKAMFERDVAFHDGRGVVRHQQRSGPYTQLWRPFDRIAEALHLPARLWIEKLGHDDLTPVQRAVKDGDRKRFIELARKGADLGVMTIDGLSLIQMAENLRKDPLPILYSHWHPSPVAQEEAPTILPCRRSGEPEVAVPDHYPMPGINTVLPEFSFQMRQIRPE